MVWSGIERFKASVSQLRFRSPELPLAFYTRTKHARRHARRHARTRKNAISRTRFHAHAQRKMAQQHTYES